MPPRSHLIAATAVLTICCAPAGCARPYSGPKTLAALGAALVVGGGTAWVSGERSDRNTLVKAGFTSSLLGVAAIVAAGGWMATSISCEVDPDCPEGDTCREIPAPPGGIPYKQCMRR